MKKEEKQYKILPNGKCQLKNPFAFSTQVNAPKLQMSKEFVEFAAANPPMDYIPHPEVKENDVVSGDPVWQWDAGMKLEINWEVIPEWKARKLQARGLKTRQVIELHPEKKEEKQNSENVIAYTGKGVGESNHVNDFVPIICGETCGCKKRLKSCPIGKGNQLNTPLRIDETKKINAITYEQILTLPNNEHGHKFQPGYDNLDGNYNYFGTSPDAMRVMTVNADYVGHTFVNIKKDGGTRTVFNGHVRSFEELQLINSLVL